MGVAVRKGMGHANTLMAFLRSKGPDRGRRYCVVLYRWCRQGSFMMGGKVTGPVSDNFRCVWVSWDKLFLFLLRLKQLMPVIMSVFWDLNPWTKQKICRMKGSKPTRYGDFERLASLFDKWEPQPETKSLHVSRRWLELEQSRGSSARHGGIMRGSFTTNYVLRPGPSERGRRRRRTTDSWMLSSESPTTWQTEEVRLHARRREWNPLKPPTLVVSRPPCMF